MSEAAASHSRRLTYHGFFASPSRRPPRVRARRSTRSSRRSSRPWVRRSSLIERAYHRRAASYLINGVRDYRSGPASVSGLLFHDRTCLRWGVAQPLKTGTSVAQGTFPMDLGDRLSRYKDLACFIAKYG